METVVKKDIYKRKRVIMELKDFIKIVRKKYGYTRSRLKAMKQNVKYLNNFLFTTEAKNIDDKEILEILNVMRDFKDIFQYSWNVTSDDDETVHDLKCDSDVNENDINEISKNIKNKDSGVSTDMSFIRETLTLEKMENVQNVTNVFPEPDKKAKDIPKSSNTNDFHIMDSDDESNVEDFQPKRKRRAGLNRETVQHPTEILPETDNKTEDIPKRSKINEFKRKGRDEYESNVEDFQPKRKRRADLDRETVQHPTDVLKLRTNKRKDSSSENEVDANNPWSNLRTSKKFDESKQIVRRKKSSGIDEIDTGKPNFLDVLTPSTPYSLLVQSLIKQLCNFIEGNNNRSHELYHKICGKLHELRMIDESYNRSEFESIRSSYETAINALVKVARENTLPINKDVFEFPLNGEPKYALEWSRYYKDFEEIEKIAHGGFADVFKAKHKLDNHIYAIKKILIKSTSVKNILPHLREVKTFASLNHINVVPYKSCWLEPLICYEPEKRLVHEDESWVTRNESANIRVTHSNSDSLRLHTNNNESFSINFEYSENHQSEKSVLSSVQSNESISNLERIRRLDLSNSSSESKALIPHVKLAWSVLFIQMKLCEKTLRNFLDERNESESFKSYYESFNLIGDNMTSNALSIFQQIYNGLEYIHNRSIVHHDLKPGNVFVSFESSTLLFQLGDFGLSCPLDSNEMVSHYGFGTRLYAAKEQLEGRICTKKSDIYSLGVVLIELLLKCKTFMECSNKVECLKKGEKILEMEPELCQLVSRLLSNKPELRPEISEIKDIITRFIDSSSNEVVRLQNIIAEKDMKIYQLMEENKALKQQLSKQV